MKFSTEEESQKSIEKLQLMDNIFTAKAVGVTTSYVSFILIIYIEYCWRRTQKNRFYRY